MRRSGTASLGTATTLLFVGAVAAFGAACGDLLVESLSNHGFFGPGQFTDGSNVDIAPIGIVGSALLLSCLLFRVRQTLAYRAGARHRRDLTAALAPRAIALMLPMILGVQVGVLWMMETAEQYLVIGHGLGGTVWLGGPPAASLCIHTAICLVATVATRRLLSVLEPRAVRLIAMLFTSAAFPPGTAPAVAWPMRVPRNSRRSLLTEIAKRGPPAALDRV
jgi:hypothetical protein